MTTVGIVSDTHNYWDERLENFLAPCAEIWHAGDIGSLALAKRINDFRPMRAVHGNIDDAATRAEYPLEQIFEIEGVRVYIRHIGGYPRRYAKGVKQILQEVKPNIFISGHSHILKVMPDRELDLLFINPGAAGMYGQHVKRTAIRLEIHAGIPKSLEVLDLPKHMAK